MSGPCRPFWILRPLWSKCKWLGSKNLFSKSCSERPYYYGQVISDFWFGGSKLASLALRAVRRCRQLASFPDAARLVFITTCYYLQLIYTCYLLFFAICYSLLSTCCLLLVTCLTTCYLILSTCYFSLLVNCSHLLHATCLFLLAPCYLLLATCYLILVVTCYFLLATCY